MWSLGAALMCVRLWFGAGSHMRYGGYTLTVNCRDPGSADGEFAGRHFLKIVGRVMLLMWEHDTTGHPLYGAYPPPTPPPHTHTHTHIYYFLTTFPFIWGSFASHVCSSM